MRYLASICCMFAPLRHEAAHARAWGVSERCSRRQRGQGAGV